MGSLAELGADAVIIVAEVCKMVKKEYGDAWKTFLNVILVPEVMSIVREDTKEDNEESSDDKVPVTLEDIARILCEVVKEKNDDKV